MLSIVLLSAIENADTEIKAQKLFFSTGGQGVPILFTKYMIKCIVDAVCRCITQSEELTSVILEHIPLDMDNVAQITQVSHSS